jgi:hypothetical protein
MRRCYECKHIEGLKDRFVSDVRPGRELDEHVGPDWQGLAKINLPGWWGHTTDRLTWHHTFG